MALKELADGLLVGPMLIGTAAPAHIATSTVTARGIVNLTATSVVDAQNRQHWGLIGDPDAP